MTSGRAVRAIVGGAAALLVVVGLYLLVRPKDEAPGGAAALRSAASEAPQPAVLPTPSPVDAAPLAVSEPADVDAGRGAAFGATPLVGPRALADIGQRIQLTGRVVDEHGMPVADAEVIHLPSPAVVKLLDRKFIPFGPRFPWADFARTRSDDRGRFVLATHELPRPDGTHASAQQAPVPSLVVRHPDFAATLFACLAYREGDFDVGDIVVPPGATIVGRLVYESGAPVAEAEIGATNIDLGKVDDPLYDEWDVVTEVLTTSSGDDGRFALGSVWPGHVTLTITATGFVPLETPVVSKVGARNDTGDIVLTRGDSIMGVVLDAQGEPLAGVKVKGRTSEVNPAEGATDTAAWEFMVVVKSNDVLDIEALTDERGAFELPTLQAERYTVLAGKDGFEVAKLAEVPIGTRDVVLTLLPSACAVVTVVDAHTRGLVDGVSATGRRRPGGSPSRHMDPSTALDVLAGDAAVAAASAEAGADAEPPSPIGLLVVRGLGSNRNTLTVSAGGCATTEVELPSVPPGGRVLQEVALAREASISGTVVDAGGAPVALAIIEVGGSTPPSPFHKPRQETADAEGRFRIGGLAAGEWKLTASAPGFVRAEPQPVSVAAEQRIEDLELTLLTGARITGIVLAVNGTPSPGCEVKALCTSVPPTPMLVEVTATGTNYRVDPAARKVSYSARSDAAGRFAIEELPAGSFDVSTEPGARAAVELPAGGAAELELQLRRPPTIRGRVRDADGPVAGAQVECLLSSESSKGWSDEAQAETSETGEFQMQLSQSGSCLLLAEHDGARAPPRRVTANWDTPVQQDLAFGGERLAGLVVDAKTKEPVPDASVWFSDESGLERDGLGKDLGHFYRSETETGADGRFETRRLQKGRYTVQVQKQGYAGATRGPLEVPSADDLRIELVAGATISGTVRAAGGAALEPDLVVMVRIVDASGDGAGPIEKRTSVRPDGSFKRSNLPAGQGVLQVLRFEKPTGVEGDSGSWKVMSETPCVLVAGETTTIDLQYAP